MFIFFSAQITYNLDSNLVKTSTAEPLYIINYVVIVYHQNEVLYIIKSQGDRVKKAHEVVYA